MVSINITKYDKLDGSKIQEAIDKSINKILPVMSNEAKNSHRFKSKTGNLERAINNNQNSVYIDDMKAKYGKYVSGGHGKWSPDPFISNAVENNLDELDMLIINEIEKTL